LEQHVHAFTEQALEIKQWDEQLLENNKKIIALQANVQKVMAHQRKLNVFLDGIKGNQENLSTIIDELDKQVRELPVQSRTPDERKREQAYTMAEEIDGELNQMQVVLKGIVDGINKGQERSSDSSNPISQIVKILNAHNISLSWIEQSAHDLESRLYEANSYVFFIYLFLLLCFFCFSVCLFVCCVPSLSLSLSLSLCLSLSPPVPVS